MQNGMVFIVGKRNILKLDMPIDTGDLFHVRRVLPIGLSVKDTENPLSSRHSSQCLGKNDAQLGEGLKENTG